MVIYLKISIIKAYDKLEYTRKSLIFSSTE